MKRLRFIGAVATGLVLSIFVGPGGASAQPPSLFVSFWCVGHESTTAVHLANGTSESVTVSPTLFLGGDRGIGLPPVTVSALGSESILLDRALILALMKHPQEGATEALGNACSHWGSLTLGFSDRRTPPRGFSAWAVSLSASHSFSINTVAVPRSSASETLASVWWNPTPDASTHFALQNTASEAAVVRPVLIQDGARIPGREFSLPPDGGAALVSLTDLFDHEIGALGAVELFSTRPVLVGRTILSAPDAGFSVPIALRRKPEAILRHSPAAPFGAPEPGSDLPADAMFYPTILAANTGQEELRASIEVVSKTGTQWDAGVIDLPPFSAARLDLRRRCDRGECPVELSGLSSVSIEVRGRPGDLLAEVLTTDASLRYSFYDPLSSSPRTSSVITGISYHIGGPSRSQIVLTNTGERPVAGGYMLVVPRLAENDVLLHLTDLPPLPARGSTAIDLHRFALEQTPDLAGRTFPSLEESETGFVLLLAPPGVIASNPTLDPSAGTCFSCPEFWGCWPRPYDPDEGWNSGGMIGILCAQSTLPPMLLAAGIYEALLLGGDADDCIFFVCRSLLVHPECEIGNHLIVRSRSNFPGGVCPTGISGNAISLRVPGFPTACFAVTANPDEQACAPM